MNQHDVHFINPFWNATGGTELHALSLYQELKPYCRPHLWASVEDPDPLLLENYPIKIMSTSKGVFPKTGTFVFVGAYRRVGRWFYGTLPRRIILSYTTFDHNKATALIKKLSASPLGIIGRALGLQKKLEVAYASPLLKSTLNVPGIVELSPFDRDLFSPATLPKTAGSFIVGRVSRDHNEKHHPDDLAVYQSLVQAGCEVRLMGASCLLESLGGKPGLKILPANAAPAHSFLQELDCFYYGTSERFTETFGRVVFEAMACGLPVVCHRRGGYADFIRHGENGFLFNTREEALSLILQLREDPALRSRMGRAARQTVLEMFSPEKRKEIIDFYTS